MLNDDLLNRYSRHILLEEIGVEGQEKLMRAAVLVVGLGGLGSPAAIYLAAAGVGELILCDDDAVDLTNLQRQILHTTAAVGGRKTDSAKRMLNDLNPHCRLHLRTQKINPQNAGELIAMADAVIDASDNYATRHLINKVCARQKKPLIFGATTGFDAQLSVFDKRRNDSPCYNCLFNEKDAAADEPCALTGVFAPLAGVVGCLLAAETIKLIAAPTLPSLCKTLLLIDGRSLRWREIRLPRDPSCEVCGDSY